MDNDIYGKSGNFHWAYDDENNILHIRDKDNHDEMSLINSIDSKFAKTLVQIIESEIGKPIDFDNIRCFLYTDGGDGFGNEVDEYIFAREGTEKNCFRPLRMKDRVLKYWYKNDPIIPKDPDFLL